MLKVTTEGKTLNVASLNSQTHADAALDLFFNCSPDAKPVVFNCEGKSGIDITGYWEHVDDESDEEMMMEGEENDEIPVVGQDEESEEESLDEEEAEVGEVVEKDDEEEEEGFFFIF